jgi:molybdate transport system ATP-binding protein
VIEVSATLRRGGFWLEAAFASDARVTALVGPSGVGKTTMLNIIAGLLRPDAGRVVVDGAVLLDTATRTFVPPHRRGIGYVFQDARLFPHLSVRRNLLYGRWFARGRAGPGLDEVATLLGIAPLLDRGTNRLSGGEAQRVALGRAILSHPRLLLMDEPLASLDDARKNEILPYIEKLRDEFRIPIVYVSHAAAEVERLADMVVRMG